MDVRIVCSMMDTHKCPQHMPVYVAYRMCSLSVGYEDAMQSGISNL